MIKRFLLTSFIVTVLFSVNSAAQRGIGIVSKSSPEIIDQVRYALVIGNSNYTNAKLKNPVNDARDMAMLLREKKFHVTMLTDANRKKMGKAISVFGSRIKGAGIGLFYFAGHGMQIDGSNFLIPVDSEIETEDDVQYEAINANTILSKMNIAGNQLNLVFLDACRNNPFARSFRSRLMGLAPMDAPKGSLISFATAPGSVAADGDGRNGIYTKHLLKQIKVPGLEVGQMMRRVRFGVQTDTNNKQTPYEMSSLTGNFFFSGKKPEESISVVQIATKQHEPSPEVEMWKLVKDSNNQKELKLFIDTYPEGKYVNHAKLKISRLENNQKLVVQKSVIPVESQAKNKVVVDDSAIAKESLGRDKPVVTFQSKVDTEPAGHKIASIDKRLPEGQLKKNSKQPIEQSENSVYSSIKSTLVDIANLTLSDKEDVKIDSSGKIINNRFNLGDGTVEDLSTGLMWASSDNGQDIDWASAIKFCDNFSAGGHKDWRMPTLKELKDLHDSSVFGLFQVTSIFNLSACCIWTSDINGSSAANYFFSKDQTQWALKIRKSYSRVLPVRELKKK